MKFLALTVLALALTSCTSNATKTPADQNESQVTTSSSAQDATPPVVQPDGPTGSPAQAAKNCTCVKIWMPVCGTNNKTYGNTCEADCAGVKYKNGACEEDSKSKQRKMKRK